MAVPDTPHYHEALAVGDTLIGGRRPCIHWLPRGKERWIREHRRAGSRIVAVELAEADDCVEIPMIGRGASLNVAVAGSLVLYRLAGLS
jgi:hypothetical protein